MPGGSPDGSTLLPFPPYGLAAWSGASAPESLVLARLEARGPVVVCGVWARYVRGKEGAGLRVGTFDGTALAAAHSVDADRSFSAQAAVAAEAVHALGDFTHPVDPATGHLMAEPQPGLLRAVIRHLEAAGDAMSSWPERTWSIDGVEVPARVLNFAGAWVGVTALADSSTFAVVVALGRGPERLELMTAPDLAAQLAAHAQADPRLLDLELKRSGIAPLPRPNRAYHPDQLAVGQSRASG